MKRSESERNASMVINSSNTAKFENNLIPSLPPQNHTPLNSLPSCTLAVRTQFIHPFIFQFRPECRIPTTRAGPPVELAVDILYSALVILLPQIPFHGEPAIASLTNGAVSAIVGNRVGIAHGEY